MWDNLRPSILLYSILFYAQMSTSVGGWLLCTCFTQFLFSVVYLCHIRQSTSAFMASLYVFCLLSLFSVLSLPYCSFPPSISKHPKAHSASSTIISNRIDANDVHITKTNYFKFWSKPLTTVLSDSDVALLLHAVVFFSDHRMVATPLASLLGVKEKTRVKAAYIPTLEAHYCKITKNPTKVNVVTGERW